MMIESINDLQPLSRIIYTKFISGQLTTNQVNTYLSLGKITQDEAIFILS